MKLFHTLSFSFLVFSINVQADWSSPISLYNNETISSPSVGVDSSGNALFVVSAFDGQYFEETGQLSQGVVSNLNSYLQLIDDTDQFNQNIAVSGGGNAIISWIEQDLSSNGFVRAALFLDGVWEAPTNLTTTSSVYSYGTTGLNMSSSNEGLIVWTDLVVSNGNNQVQWNLYKDGAWINPSSPIIQTADYLNVLVLSGNTKGQAMTIWTDQTSYTLQGAVFNGSSWTVNTSIATDISTACSPPLSISMNAQGNALFLWSNASGGLSSSTYIDGSYGVEQFPFPDSSFTITSVAVAFSDNGIGAAIWTTVDESGTVFSVYGNRYINGAWSSSNVLLDIVTGSDANTYSANAGTDAYGNALAIWKKTDNSGNSAVYYAISETNSTTGFNTWSNLESLSTDNTSSNPVLSMNSSGNATVVWSISDAGPQTAQAVYTKKPLFSPQPPQNFQGNQIKNRFLMQTDLVNVLNWTASPSQGIVSYYLFRNNTQIATVAASGPLTFLDHNRKKGVVDVYQLTAVNSSGFQSLPVTTSVP